jgi:hypothetical protein
MTTDRPYGCCRLVAALLLLSAGLTPSAAASEQVVDFESAVIYVAGDKPNRVEQWVEKGVVMKLAREPKTTKAKGRLMFFPHPSSGRKGILNAIATEGIPVQATFPKQVSTATVALWGSTGTPALIEAFDSEGAVVDRAKLESTPDRKGPGEPIPIFTMTVSAKRIAYIQFSGPREGEYLVADEIRFTPIEDGAEK